MRKLKVINLFGGPGSGKSTTRAQLFSTMKLAGLNVEEATEFAKDIKYEYGNVSNADQLWILANQNRRLERLKGKVSWVVTDSPLLLGAHYAPINYLSGSFNQLLCDLWDTYSNYNVFINRVKPYNQNGRDQKEDEAKEIDRSLEELLNKLDLPFYKVDGDENAGGKIFEHLKIEFEKEKMEREYEY